MSKFKNLFSPYRGLPKEVYIIFIAKVINAMGCFVMPMMTLIMTQKIGLSSQAAGMYISISGILFMPAAWLGGKLADTIGRKVVIVIFDFMAAALYIVCGFIHPSIELIYIIILSGACMGVAGPAHDSIMADITTPENRNGAYALTYMGWNLGFAIGPIIGGMLFEKHLSLAFYGNAAAALTALSLIIIFIKETIHRTKEIPIGKNRVMEQREDGSIFKVISKRPILIYFSLIIFGYNFVYSQWSFMMPMHVAHNFSSMGPTYYGFLASFNGLVVILFTPVLTKLSEGIKSIRKMVYGGLLYTVGFGMLGLINSLPFFFIACFIFTLGEIVLSISTMPFIINYTPASHRGRMSAMLPTIFGMGYTLGPLVMGNVLLYISIERGWIWLGIMVCVFSGLMYMLEKYDKRRALEIIESEGIAE